MLPALRRDMPFRDLLPVLPLLPLLLAACGRDAVSLRGSMAEGSDVSDVWVGGATERARVEADSFHLEALQGDSVELRFTDGKGEPAYMLLVGLPDGGDMRLDGIWVKDGLAFPARVSLPEAGVLTVNGLRMAGAELLPAQVDVEATLLAIGDDALLVRPSNPQLPDLRVVVTPGTVARSPDGEPTRFGRLEFGDSLRVVGTAEQGYVVAAEVIVPRKRANED